MDVYLCQWVGCTPACIAATGTEVCTMAAAQQLLAAITQLHNSWGSKHAMRATAMCWCTWTDNGKTMQQRSCSGVSHQPIMLLMRGDMQLRV